MTIPERLVTPTLRGREGGRGTGTRQSLACGIPTLASASARARGPAPPPAGPRAPETRARDRACAGARRRFLGTRARRNPGGGDSASEARRAAGFLPREAEELHFSALAAPKVEAAPGPGYGASSPPQPAPCAARPLEALRSSEVFHLGRGKVLNLLRVVG